MDDRLKILEGRVDFYAGSFDAVVAFLRAFLAVNPGAVRVGPALALETLRALMAPNAPALQRETAEAQLLFLLGQQHP